MKRKEALNENEIKEVLNKLVQKGYLKKIKDKYMDSNRVTSLIKQGKTRKEISKILEKVMPE